MLSGVPGRRRGAPTPAEPLGASEPRAWSAPIAAKAGLSFPERDMTATARFDLNEAEEYDEVDDDPVPTASHRRPF